MLTAWLIPLLYLGSVSAVGAAAIGAWMARHRQETPGAWPTHAANGVTMLVLSLGYLGWRHRWGSWLPAPAPRLDLTTAAPWVGLALAGAGSYVASLQLGRMVGHRWPQRVQVLEDLVRSTLALSGPRAVGAYLSLTLAVPLAEELWFRDLYLRALTLHLPAWAAVGLSALMFGAVHLNLAQAVLAGSVGLVWGWLYLAFGSLWVPLGLHVLYWNMLYATARHSPAPLLQTPPRPGLLLAALATTAVGLGLTLG